MKTSMVVQWMIILLNLDKIFFKSAKEKGRGEQLSREYDMEYEGNRYRAQIFERSIVYAPVTDWHKTDVILRAN